MQRIILELKSSDDGESILKMGFFRKDYKSFHNEIPVKELSYSVIDYLSIILGDMLKGQNEIEDINKEGDKEELP